MFKEDVNRLVDEMTSFYQEYLPIDSSYEKLLNAYIQSFLVLWQEAEYLKKHIALETAPTLQTIRYAKIDVTDAMYSKRDAVRFNNINTLEEKLDVLNKRGHYVEFTFSELGSRTPIVYDMTLKEFFSGEDSLLLYQDYFIRENRMYLLPDYIINTEKQVSELHAFDIKVDNHMIEKKWAAPFKVETGPLLPRYKYRDVISAFRRLLKSDLSIREMKESVLLATGWEEFNIQDKLSPDLHPNLRKLYDEWMISPARFIVSLPEELIAEKMQLNIVLSLLDESKEAQVNYLVLFGIYRLDHWEHYSDSHAPTIHMGLREIKVPESKDFRMISLKNHNTLFPSHRYDVGRHYDYKLKYDAKNLDHLENVMDAGEYVLFDDPSTMMDTPWAHQAEYFKVTHIDYPEIPREFKGEGEGELTFTFKTNKDGTKHYELLGSDAEYGVYEVLERISNDESNETNQIIHDASESGMRYYKVRAIAGSEQSLLTLPVDRSTF